MPTEMSEMDAVSTSLVELEVSVQIDDLHADWKRVGYLANYLAEYIAYCFPQRERAENLLSTITNELLEAVIHLAPEESALTLHCSHSGDRLMLDVKHQVKAALASPYLLFVEQLGEKNHEEEYLQMLTAEIQPELYFNQLGLMMLEYDFDVHLSLKNDQPENAGQTEPYLCTHVDVLDEVLSK